MHCTPTCLSLPVHREEAGAVWGLGPVGRGMHTHVHDCMFTRMCTPLLGHATREENMAASDPGGTAARWTTCKTRSCCKCNGSGVCRNCSCVKACKACTNCLPSRRNGCFYPPPPPPPPPRNSNVDKFLPGLVLTTSADESTTSSTSTSADPLCHRASGMLREKKLRISN